MTDTPMGGASVSEVLAAAADLLEKPGAWTQFDNPDEYPDGETARDASGNSVPGDDPTAVCFCVFGAIERICPSPLVGREADRLLAASLGMSTGAIVDWNDAPERTQAEVVTALRQAARQASNPTAEGV